MTTIEAIKQLTTAIQSQVPSVVGIADDGNDTFRIDYDGTETDDDIATAEAIAINFMESPAPDWPGFRTAIILNSSIQRVLEVSPIVGSNLISTLWAASENPTLFGEVVAWWDALVTQVDPVLDANEIAAINTIATDNNIPLSLADDGTMEIG